MKFLFSILSKINPFRSLSQLMREYDEFNGELLSEGLINENTTEEQR